MIGRCTAVASIAAVLFLCAFLWQGETSDAAQEATVFALMSAVFWGMGSVGGPNRWNNGMNVFAAFAAAAATGFAVPSDPFCRGRFVALICEIRAGLIVRGVLPGAPTGAPASSPAAGPPAPRPR